MNNKFIIFVCLFTFILNLCEDVNVIGKLPNLFECHGEKNGTVKECCLATFKSGGKYYSYCSEKSKSKLKDELKNNDYKHIEIFCAQSSNKKLNLISIFLVFLFLI